MLLVNAKEFDIMTDSHLRFPALVTVAETHDRCGESPVWDASAQAVYWVDINGFRLHRMFLSNREVQTWNFPEALTAVCLTSLPSVLLLVFASRIALWDVKQATFRSLDATGPDWPKERNNDARIGPDNRIWIGTMGNNVGLHGEDLPLESGVGRLMYHSDEGVSNTPLTGIDIGNTVAWSPEGDIFYFGDSLKNCIWAFDFEPATSEIKNRREFFRNFERGIPDGSIVDSQGYLWNARYGGGCVVRVSPDGTVDRIVDVPAKNPTSCTFGGANLDLLFITSAVSDEPEAGNLFAIAAGVRGQVERRLTL
jgi:sugar lactone lactonase YvrE